MCSDLETGQVVAADHMLLFTYSSGTHLNQPGNQSHSSVCNLALGHAILS